MEKIKSSEIGKIIKNNIKYVIISTFVFGFLGFFYESSRTKDLYIAESSIIVSENKAEDITYNSLMLNEKLSNIYQELLNSNDLYMKAGESLGMEDKAGSFKKSLKTELNAQAGIITFKYKGSGKEESGKILQNIIEQFRKDVNEYLGKDNVEYIQSVTVKEYGKGSAKKLAMFLAAFAFILSLLVVVTKEFFQALLKSESFFEELGIEVLGVIDEK